jgi:hypothetical protein
MANQTLRSCAYRVLRYTPNLVRDEWVNIGVVLFEPPRARIEIRLIEEPAEFARVRRLHPQMDEGLLRALQADFEAQFAAQPEDPVGLLARLDESLSNVLQLSPQGAVLTEDFEAELGRLYERYVEPPGFRSPAAEDLTSRHGIRRRVRAVFRTAGILDRVEKSVRVDEFTFPGDPFHLDFGYRRNGARGFVHALALGRDPASAKVLAYTAERIRAKVESAEFTAITEVEAQPENRRHQFVASLLAEEKVSLLAVARLAEFASRLRAELP